MAKTNSTRRNSAFNLPTAPATRQEANDWFNSATYGAATQRTDIVASTKTNIVPLQFEVDDAVRLMEIGYEAYINEQLTANTNLSLLSPNATTGYLEIDDSRFGTTPTANNFNVSIYTWFYANAIHGFAQIRHKATYALSQIFVINTGAERVSDYLYFHNLEKATLSNNTSTFRELLSDVVYNQSMAFYLTYINNKKEDLATNRRTDQNFMRELWQLFGTGLVHLNLDGTPVLNSSGNEIAVYDQTHIDEGSWVFTGLITNGNRELYEAFFTNDHETRAKKLPPYLPDGANGSIPATTGTYFRPLEYPPNRGGYLVTVVNADTFTVTTTTAQPEARGLVNVSYSLSSDYSNPVTAQYNQVGGARTVTFTKVAHGLATGARIYSYSTAQLSIEKMMTYLFNHPTLPPFFCKNMIKFFVTSNPTPEYVKRVTLKFLDNGNGVRGDISAVVKAILLDREAILPFGVNPNNHGRHLSLLEREVKTIRAFRNEVVHYQIADWSEADGSRLSNFTVVPQVFTKPTHIKQNKAIAVVATGSFQFGRSPSVFSFGRPGYVPPGTLLGTLGKTAPELQTNTISAQTFWFNAVARMCETEIFGGKTNLTNEISRFGLDFNLTTANNAMTVTAKTTTSVTFQGTFNFEATGGARTNACIFIRRSDGKKHRAFEVTRPLGAGLQSFTINSEFFFNDAAIATIALNDVFDFSPRMELGHAGFPSPPTDSGAEYATNPAIFTFNKLASLINSDVATPTLAQLNVVIDYIDTLLARPITPAVRALMVSAGQLAATEGGPQITGSAAHNNHYLNLASTRAQKRVRRMMHVLLVSPEYSNQR